MLTDLCQELKNWFDRDLPKYFGAFSIHDNQVFYINYANAEISLSDLGLAKNQFFRIVGSKFNDGVVKYDAITLQNLTEEEFRGAVWFMAIPPSVLILDKRIEDWKAKYEDTTTSPYISESFGGYSRTLAKSSDGSSVTWQKAFKSDLNRWRKI